MVTSRHSTNIKITGFLVSLLLSRILVTIIVSFIPQWFPIEECIEHINRSSCVHSEKRETDDEFFISVLYSTSQITTLIVSPMIGIVVDAVGFDKPIIAGIICLFLTSVLFALAKDIYYFIIARIVHGIGASCIFIAGTGLASCSNYSPRVINNIYLLEWLIYGFDVFGPVYGGVAVSLFGQQETFFILAFVLMANMCLYIGGMMISDVEFDIKSHDLNKTDNTTYIQQGFQNLSKNRQIVSSAVIVSVAVMPKAFLDPILPVWMARDFGSDSWQIGMIYLPQWICFEIAIIFSACLIQGKTNKTWIIILVNLLLISVFSTMLFVVSTVWAIAIPTSLLSFTTAIVRFMIFTIMAFLSNKFFPLDVGRIFAIYDFFTILPFAIGPLIALPIYEYAGIFWIGLTMCLITLCSTPFSLTFRGIFDVEMEGERERLSVSPSQEPMYTTTPVRQQDDLKSE